MIKYEIAYKTCLTLSAEEGESSTDIMTDTKPPDTIQFNDNNAELPEADDGKVVEKQGLEQVINDHPVKGWESPPQVCTL